MADLPEPDWITLSESAKRAAQAFGAELSAVEPALVAAFHDGKIRTRGRCRSYFGHATLRDLEGYTWDRASVRWQDSEFAIPRDRDQLGRKIYIFEDVVVHREDLEKWINGAMPDSQHGPQEPAETPSQVQPPPVEHPKQPPRKKPAEPMHNRWVERAKELRKADKKMTVSEISVKIWREENKLKDPNTRGETRDKGTIRRVITARQKEWDLPPKS